MTATVLKFERLLSPVPPLSHPITDVVIYRWHDGKPDEEIRREAEACMSAQIPFKAHGKNWLVTYCEMDETDCFAIEGVEWV